MGFKPLKPWVIIKPEFVHSKFLLKVPPPITGIVVIVHNGCTEVSVGDHVLFPKFSGRVMQLDGQEVLIMKTDEISAILEN